MPPVVTRVGASILTARAGQRSGAPSIAGTLRFFTSATDPTVNSVPGDFTEATFGGYARKAVADDSFTPTALDDGHAVAPDTGNEFTWVVGATGQTVTGWLYVLSSGELLVAERFATPQVLVAGATFKLAVFLTGAPEV